jgi:hypothetical protein
MQKSLTIHVFPKSNQLLLSSCTPLGVALLSSQFFLQRMIKQYYVVCSDFRVLSVSNITLRRSPS